MTVLKEKVQQLLKITGGAATSQMLMAHMINAFADALLSDLTSEKEKAAGEKIRNLVQEVLLSGKEEIEEVLSNCWMRRYWMRYYTEEMRYYTEEELDGLLAFYRSSVGQKVLKGVLIAMLMEAGEKWGAQRVEGLDDKIKALLESKE